LEELWNGGKRRIGELFRSKREGGDVKGAAVRDLREEGLGRRDVNTLLQADFPSGKKLPEPCVKKRGSSKDSDYAQSSAENESRKKRGSPRKGETWRRASEK